MRKLIVLTLLILSYAASAEVYRYTDDKGVIHYTDKPPTKDAKPVDLPPLQTYSPTEKPAPPVASAPTDAAALPKSEFQVSINSPTPEETFREVNPDVKISVSVMPGLVAGYSLTYFADGIAVTTIRETHWVIGGLFRGEHTLAVALIDSGGKEVARSAPVTVYMMPPSIGHAH